MEKSLTGLKVGDFVKINKGRIEKHIKIGVIERETPTLWVVRMLSGGSGNKYQKMSGKPSPYYSGIADWLYGPATKEEAEAAGAEIRAKALASVQVEKARKAREQKTAELQALFPGGFSVWNTERGFTVSWVDIPEALVRDFAETIQQDKLVIAEGPKYAKNKD